MHQENQIYNWILATKKGQPLPSCRMLTLPVVHLTFALVPNLVQGWLSGIDYSPLATDEWTKLNILSKRIMLSFVLFLYFL